MLARAVSLLYLVAAQNRSLEDVCKASDAILATLMPSNWVDQKEQPAKQADSVKTFEDIVSKVFG